MQDSLGDRMKTYESVTKNKLIRRMPVIIRLDGKAFHTFTKGFDRPYDENFHNIMNETMISLCKEIQGCVLGYTQSDEISLVLVDYNELGTSAWYDNQVQKIVSVSASLATLFFNKSLQEEIKKLNKSLEEFVFNSSEFDFMTVETVDKIKKKIRLLESKNFKGCFDSRAFNLPVNEVVNYLIWRQKDATRNSINSLAQTLFKHKEIQGIKSNMLQNKMLTEKDVNWNDTDTVFKRGCCAIKFKGSKDDKETWTIDYDVPIFTEDREYVNECVYVGEYERS